MGIKKCENCGAAVDVTRDSCPYCGTRYPHEHKEPQQTIQINDTTKKIFDVESINQSAKDVSNNLNNGCLLALVFILCWPLGLVLIILSIFRNKNNNKK